MKPGEKGFTLIELLVAITIIALASGAAGTAIFQVLRNTERNSDLMTAVRQVENAGYQISRDAGMAQSVNATANLTLPDFLILSWTEQDTGDDYEVTYTLEDMPEGQLKTMLRNQSVNGGSSNITFVAQYIDPDPEKTSGNFTSGTLTLTVTSTVGVGSLTQSETRIYEIVPRPD